MVSSLEAASLWYTLSAITSGFLGVGTTIAFFVVAFVVRRTRPDAFGLLVTAASLDFANMLLGHGLSFAVPVLTMKNGGTPEDMAQALFFTHLLTGGVSLTAHILLLVGVVRLAKPPATGNPFAEGRYG